MNQYNDFALTVAAVSFWCAFYCQWKYPWLSEPGLMY